jgi:hypothetical protein
MLKLMVSGCRAINVGMGVTKLNEVAEHFDGEMFSMVWDNFKILDFIDDALDYSVLPQIFWDHEGCSGTKLGNILEVFFHSGGYIVRLSIFSVPKTW